MNIWAVIKEALKIVTAERVKKAEQAERKAVARAFNDRYTFRREWIKGMPDLPGEGLFGLKCRSGYAWMCPDCNKIYHPYEINVFTGLQYPACCGTFKGCRYEAGIKERD
jgi:hypothetical protein